MDIKNDIINLGVEFLERRGIDNARQEAIWLFEHVFGKPEEIHLKEDDDIEKLNEVARIASLKNTKRYNELITRRAEGEPLQYLLGEWEFYGYPMKVGEGVLIPRPETEFLIDIGLDYLKKKSSGDAVVIDLCAGSGCVAIAMAKECGCNAAAVELSEQAAKFARENIKMNKVEKQVTLYCDDIFNTALIEKMPQADCIFANPPYLSAEDMKRLQREVTFEPPSALYGGEDGLDYYRKLFELWKSKLKQGGIFAVEVGDKQAQDVCRFMREAGLEPAVKKDYASIERIVYTKYQDDNEPEKELDRLIKERDEFLNSVEAGQGGDNG